MSGLSNWSELTTRALRGGMTHAECSASGQHELLVKAEVPHTHRPSAEELLAEAKRIREWRRDPEDTDWRCRHGTFIGDPYGPDYMCGTCEGMGQSEEAGELEEEAGRLHGRWARANVRHELARRGGQPNSADILTYGPDWARGYEQGAAEEVRS